ncbi:MAG: hypothetical protein KAJ62_08980 [Desulfobacteraceae bacterium]|nr:hypothetical protein [Desulfobacteraceae bacterium]
MMGNVYQGVLLNQNPIFLGGQGGLVGPSKIGFGCLTVAGSVIRKDEIKTNRLILGGSLKEASIARGANVYNNVPRIYNNNIGYISSLISLLNWYREIRSLFVTDYFSEQLHSGMILTLEIAINERIIRLEDFINKLKKNDSEKQKHLIKNFPEYKNFLTKQKTADFTDSMPELAGNKNDYIEYIKTLDSSVALKLSRWLYSIEYKIFEKIKL